MDIGTLFTLSDLPSDFEDEIRNLLQVCDHLNALTESENHALLSDNTIHDKEASYKKILLLEKFEVMAAEVFARLRVDAPHNMAIQTYLIERVQDFQARLKVNTGLHMHAMSCGLAGGDGGSALCH